MQPEDRRDLSLVEMTPDGFANIGAKFFPSIGLRDNRVAKGEGDPTPIGFIFSDLKHDFAHAFNLTQVGVTGKGESSRTNSFKG